MYNDLSLRPFLLLAFVEWCERFGISPFLLVHIDEHVLMPNEYVKDEVVVLNVSQEATKDLKINADTVAFYARFSGVAHLIQMPIGNVVGCFSSDPLQQALQFDYQQQGTSERDSSENKITQSKPQATTDKNTNRPKLTVVKK